MFLTTFKEVAKFSIVKTKAPSKRLFHYVIAHPRTLSARAMRQRYNKPSGEQNNSVIFYPADANERRLRRRGGLSPPEECDKVTLSQRILQCIALKVVNNSELQILNAELFYIVLRCVQRTRQRKIMVM